MHPALPQAFRSFIGTFEGAYHPVCDLKIEQKLNDDFIEKLKKNDLGLKRWYPAYEVWPIDAQVALHAMAWRMGPNFMFPAFRAALTSRLLPDFITAAYESKSPHSTVGWNLAIVQLFKNADKALSFAKLVEELNYRPARSSFGFESSNEVVKVATPVSVDTFVSALNSVFTLVEGVNPTTKQIAMLYGQWALETNTGKAMFNNAVGNIKITQDQKNNGVKFFSQFTGDSGVVRPDGVIGEGVNQFRAYATLDDGINSWLSLLKNTRYKAGWDALKVDDATGFATGIARGGYVAAPSQDAYIVGVLSRYDDFMKNIAPTLKIVPRVSPASPATTSNSNPPLISKTKIAIGVGGLAALGTAYLMIHPIAAVSTAVMVRSGYKKTKEFLSPSLDIAKKAGSR